MPNAHGDFIWYELMTNDAEKAQAFYTAVVGWTFAPAGQNDKDYRQFSINNAVVGGVLPLTPEMTSNGAKPCWLGYIGVDDVDQTTASIEKAGGRIHMEPQDIPDVGRFAFVSDPQGALFYIMKGTSHRTSKSFAPTEPIVGRCAWNELATSDLASAVAFYSDQFGWRQDGDMDMGPMGKYQFLYQDQTLFGGVMQQAPEVPMPAWSFYFRVPDIDKALDTIKTQGGQIAQTPIAVPGGDFALSGVDPQGAAFSLVGARTQKNAGK